MDLVSSSLEYRNIEKVQISVIPCIKISVIKEGIGNNLLFILRFISSLSLKPCLFPDGTETIFSVSGTVLSQAVYLKPRGNINL
jgi:hypothetical protein